MKRKDFKLYHVTNFEFLPSIKKNGLGARNPIKENNLLEILKYLFELCELRIPNEKIVEEYRVVTQIMINQSNQIVQNPFTSKYIKPNFLHGDLYLNSSEERAINFAVRTKYGSEILTRVLFYMKVLDLHEIHYDFHEFNCKIHLKSLSLRKPKLALIKFNYFDDLKLEIVENDKKTDLNKKFLDVKYFNENIMEKSFSFQLQFKTSDIIPTSKLKLYEIRLYNVPNEEFDYTLIKI